MSRLVGCFKPCGFKQLTQIVKIFCLLGLWDYPGTRDSPTSVLLVSIDWPWDYREFDSLTSFLLVAVAWI